MLYKYLAILQHMLFLSVESIIHVPKYCREKERLIGSEELDDYLLVEAAINSTILLECHYCNVTETNTESKIWFWNDGFQTGVKKEVELGMMSNVSLNRVYMTSDLSLVIKEVHISDAGIYQCQGINGEEAENKYNYRIEPVNQTQDDVNIQRGNITDWENYREINFLPVTLRISVSKMEEFVNLRKNGINLEVLSELGPWGLCENCINGYGTRSSETLCRIKRKINNIHQGNSSVLEFFKSFPIIPCRSYVMEIKFPSLSRAVRYLPSFILEDKCNNCKEVKKIKKFSFKYKKVYILYEGSHLTISCPESNTESIVVWKKNGITMKKGAVMSSKKKGLNSKTIVDVFSTLYLIEVTTNEKGNYTCYVNGEKMMTLKVTVVSKSKFLSKAFIRHSKYLGLILLLTSFCYCSCIIKSFRQKNERDSYIKLRNEELVDTDDSA